MKTITCTTDIKPESKFDLDSVLFFDIESTGLSKERSNVYLIGCAYKENGSWTIRQYFAETLSDEEAVVTGFLDFAKNFRTLVHFNGDTFDVPYIDYKAEEYGHDFRLSFLTNYDILKRARKAKKLLSLQSLSQKSVEAFLKIRRDDEMNGGLLIPVYFDYQRTADPRLERLLLLHNFDDIQGMLKISPIVNYADITEGRFTVSAIHEEQENMTVDLALESGIPRAFEKSGAHYLIAANDDFMQVVIDTYCGTARYYLPDYKNYYYLPEEDRVIHKDLAQFVESGHKVKATKKNCYLSKESVFLPQPGKVFSPCFCLPEEPKSQYFEAETLKAAEESAVKDYVLELIRK